MNWPISRRAQPVGSLTNAAWPVRGTGSASPAGSRWTTAAASSSGVRRSSRPLTTSAGTLGRAPTGAGGAEAAGQPAHSASSCELRATWREKGPKALSGWASTACWAAAARSANGVARAHGKVVSSHAVAAKAPAENAFDGSRLPPPFGPEEEAHERRGVAPQRRGDRARDVGAERRVLVAGEQQVEQGDLVDGRPVTVPPAIDHRALQRARAEQAHELLEVAGGSREIPRQAPPVQSSRSTRGTAWSVECSSGSSPSGGTTESSTSFSTASGCAWA